MSNHKPWLTRRHDPIVAQQRCKATMQIMQKLKQRNTHRPTNAPLVRRNSDLALNISEGRRSVQDSKTCFNDSEVDITHREQWGKDLRVPSVYVLSRRGEPLMPTTPHKARQLLNKGEAHVYNLTPFTIQLDKPTGETTQPLTLGIDSGYSHVGTSVIGEKREVFSSELELRKDTVKLNSERRQYRRGRRQRHTWYRKPRFLNRKKDKNWLAPSIMHKLNSHVKMTDRLHKLLPISSILVETASFDIQKIMNNEITGKEYQEGPQKDFDNVRAYVLFRDNYACQHCKKQNVPLITHHLESRQVGGNRPDNLITLCKTCHEHYHQNKIALKIKKTQGFKAETFMTMVKRRLLSMLREKYKNVEETFGYITKNNRLALGLEKSHSNDAFCIAGGTDQVRNVCYNIIQRRKNNRCLQIHRKGYKPSIRRQRYSIQPMDRVVVSGKEYRAKGMFSYGTWIRVNENGKDKNFSIKKVSKVFHESTMIWT